MLNAEIKSKWGEIMNRNMFAALLLSGAAMFSSVVWADALEAEMKTLAKSTKAFATTNDIETAKQQLAIMRQAALASKQALPYKLETLPSEHEQVIAYQAALDQLVLEIDKVTALVEQGQLDQAKAEAMSLIKIRNEGHKKFN